MIKTDLKKKKKKENLTGLLIIMGVAGKITFFFLINKTPSCI